MCRKTKFRDNWILRLSHALTNKKNRCGLAEKKRETNSSLVLASVDRAANSCAAIGEVRYESLHQPQMRFFWTNRLFGGDPLSAMQVGSEVHASGQRDVCFHKGCICRGDAVKFRSGSEPDILVPQISVLAHKLRHHLNAFRVVDND